MWTCGPECPVRRFICGDLPDDEGDTCTLSFAEMEMRMRQWAHKAKVCQNAADAWTAAIAARRKAEEEK